MSEDAKTYDAPCGEFFDDGYDRCQTCGYWDGEHKIPPAHPSLTNAVVLSGEDAAALRAHLTTLRSFATDMAEVFLANRALALLPPAKAMP